MTFVAYLPAFRAGYVWDDEDHVAQTPMQRTVTAIQVGLDQAGGDAAILSADAHDVLDRVSAVGNGSGGVSRRQCRVRRSTPCYCGGFLFAPRHSRRRMACRGDLCNSSGSCRIRRMDYGTKNTLSGFFYLLAMIAALRTVWIGRKAIGQQEIKAGK